MNQSSKKQLVRRAMIYNAVQELNAAQRDCLKDLIGITLILIEQKTDTDPMQWNLYVYTKSNHYTLNNVGLMVPYAQWREIDYYILLDNDEENYLTQLLTEGVDQCILQTA